ncbi:hypothetical protein BT63DRAFT_108522 [Microthyrium microscopicum]|uniref:Zn(2)-C6 fungal-type domain-containing protein n=1 Tax=Microthyrium microscopicum TaxID=703497 RepID=A0A6A6TVY5_9PEZI|nr:hypothetical protein BT63DRAFT_108522 [Microthyrium microscopicum]
MDSSKDDDSTGLSSKYSCIICHKRKVKCDRAHPCSNCVKNEATCEYVAPPAPRRKRKKTDDEALKEKVEKYEEQLRALGVKVDESESHLMARSRTSSEQVEAKRRRTNSADNFSPKVHQPEERKGSVCPKPESEGSLLLDAGKSRYVENNLWMSISDELPNSRPLILQDQQENSTDEDQEGTEFDPGSIIFGTRIAGDVASYYPRPTDAMAFWKGFKENVDPITKIVHIPTVQKLIELSCQNVHCISRTNLTLLFAIHLIAIESMSDEEVKDITGENKSIVFKRLLYATQQCFIKGGLLRTSDLTMLTAFILYILGIRCSTDTQTIASLMALAIRVAQRIGLHRDITDHLRPYDIEMRRRVWKQLLLQDWIISELAGITPFHEMYPQWWHTPNPRNLNDADFDVNTTMENLPASKIEPTEMFICQMRYNFGTLFVDGVEQARRRYNVSVGDAFNFSGGSIAERDARIDRLEQHLQDAYLRYVNPIDPVHHMVAIVARAAIANIRIRSHHPRQYADFGASLQREEHDRLFNWSLQALQYDNLIYTTTSLRRFRWHSRQLFQYHPLIYLLTSVRYHRLPTSLSVQDDMWITIQTLITNRPEMIERKQVLHTAIGMLALRAWEVFEHDRKSARQPYTTPPFIALLKPMAGGAVTGSVPPKKVPYKPFQQQRQTQAPTSRPSVSYAPDPQEQQQQSQSFTSPESHVSTPWSWHSNDLYNNTTSAMPQDVPSGDLWSGWDQILVNAEMPINTRG